MLILPFFPSNDNFCTSISLCVCSFLLISDLEEDLDLREDLILEKDWVHDHLNLMAVGTIKQMFF